MRREIDATCPISYRRPWEAAAACRRRERAAAGRLPARRVVALEAVLPEAAPEARSAAPPRVVEVAERSAAADVALVVAAVAVAVAVAVAGVAGPAAVVSATLAAVVAVAGPAAAAERQAVVADGL